jgi:hypothetical protein
MRKKALSISGILIFLIILFPVLSLAAVCPEVVSLGSFSGGKNFDPLRVALDGKGNVYVTDNDNDALLVFDYNGNKIGKMFIEKPLGVAVDSSGNIYIGSALGTRSSYSGKVDVYGSGLNYLYSLGKGMGEFQYPLDIGVDAGRVYVADDRANQIGVYDKASGEFLFAVGAYGTSDGDLNHSNGVDLDSLGNLYVLDRALYYDSGGGNYAPGASGHIFTRNADGTFTFSKRFGTYSSSGAVGAVSKPGGLALDASGRVYITDYIKGNIQIFDGAGNALCAFSMGTYTPYPLGAEIGGDGRLLVTLASSIVIYGVDDYVKLAVSPSSLEFDAQQCGSTPPAQTATISNEGPGVLIWTLSSDVDWITASATTGSINGIASVNVSISVDPTNLASGTNSGTITVSADGASQKVAVTVNVLPPPVLSVEPGSFTFEVKGNNIPPAETLYVDLNGDLGGSFTWDASTGSSAWISVSPSSGPSNTQTMANVSINGAALETMDGGQYTGAITVTSGCATGSPAEATVNLTYIKGGTISVSTNVAEATFTIAGPETFTGSGTSYVVDAVPEGSYTITFGEVPGFKAPSSYALSVSNGAETAFVGDYMDLRENNNIITTAGVRAWYVSDEVVIYDEAGVSYGSIVVPSSPTDGESRNADDVENGVVTASGDVDGDGSGDIIVGRDKGTVTGYGVDGTEIAGLNFRAFDYDTDVDLAVGDVDGDGVDEIIVSAGIGSNDQPEVRVFGYENGAVHDTGIYFLASSERTGVNVASGDIDGDGAAEILTVKHADKTAVEVRVWEVDTSAGSGAWAVADAGVFSAGASINTDITAADLDADAVDEIIVSTLPKPSDKMSVVTAYSALGIKVLEFTVPSSEKCVNLAAGDLDMDGSAEIVVGEGSHAKNTAVVRIYGPDGVIRGEFTAFDNSDIHGVRVSLGQLVE